MVARKLTDRLQENERDGGDDGCSDDSVASTVDSFHARDCLSVSRASVEATKRQSVSQRSVPQPSEEGNKGQRPENKQG